jgi:glutathione S-transferase
MKLFHMRGACSLADLIVLEWAGAEYEVTTLDLRSVKAPEYLAINPGGTVPLLVDGPFTLTENIAILGYLADTFPGTRLLGDGTPRGRAEVMRWAAFLNSDVHKAFKPIFTPHRFLPDPAFAGRLADTARMHVSEYLGRLDRQLEGRNWLTGERSIADPYLFVITRWAAGKKVGMSGFPNLLRFSERMRADPAVQKALAIDESP